MMTHAGSGREARNDASSYGIRVIARKRPKITAPVTINITIHDVRTVS